MPRRTRASRQWGTALLVATTLVVPACGSRIGAPDPASEQGETVLDLWRALFWVALALGGLVVALLGWVTVRYRRRRDDDGSLPPQTKGHIPLEVVYTAIPLVIVAVLFTAGVRAEDGLDRDRRDLRVEVTGFQWQWRFHYPDHDVTVVGSPGQVPELVLPLDRDVRLLLASADVAHSFFVPGFLTKRDLIPGIQNTLDVHPTRAGTFRAHCAEFCGIDHAAMNFAVRVVPAGEFDEWVEEQA